MQLCVIAADCAWPY